MADQRFVEDDQPLPGVGFLVALGRVVLTRRDHPLAGESGLKAKPICERAADKRRKSRTDRVHAM